MRRVLCTVLLAFGTAIAAPSGQAGQNPVKPPVLPPVPAKPATPTGVPVATQPQKPTTGTGQVNPRSVGGPVALVGGQIVDATGRAIASAAVRLIGLASMQTTVTDARGHFSFGNIAPGEYVVTARKSGFYDGAFGKRRSGGEPLPLTLSAGQAIPDLQIELFRAAVITGSILDEASEPVIGATVAAMRRTFADGEWKYTFAGRSTTDDNGVYRIFGLEPGEYLISTPATQLDESLPPQIVRISSVPPTERSDQAYPPIFYPASRYFLLAQPVLMNSGEVRYAINFQWTPVPARSISGRLVGPIGSFAEQLVKLVPLDSQEVAVANEAAIVLTTREGNFLFEKVPAGEYRLEAGGAPAEFWGLSTVVINDENISNLTVEMRHGVRLSGRISATAPGGAVAAQNVSLTITPAQPGLSTPRSFSATAEATFEATNLIPGQYYVRVSRLPAGWWVKSINQGPIDLMDRPAIADEDAHISIALTDRPTVVLGSVRDMRMQAASGAMVVVIPSNASQQWNPNRTRQLRASTNGQFAISGLPAGEYLIVAFDDAMAEGWQDPKMLAQLRTLATRLTLREEESRTIQLRLSTVRR